MAIHEILKTYWGHEQFRPLQEEVINSALAGKDTLALMPTGGGKSVCFQVPALAKEGICIVVSPLIALMKDQIRHLQEKNIPSVALYSGLTSREIDIALDNCIYGNMKFLYLSPERLMTDITKERISKMNVNLIAVDEAHCISKWGYDFRPPYLELAELRKLHPDVPVMALTATATIKVRQDIMDNLEFREGHEVFQRSFTRENLSYVVLNEEDKLRKLFEIYEKVKGTGIIYVRTRGKTKEVASLLNKKGLSADYYHAGLKPETRAAKQDSWVRGATRIIVCTNAFGMGIDKPDVRTVVHLDLPDSLEAYYQEAGRAGRDDKRSFAIVLINNRDVTEARKRFNHYFPDFEEVKNTYIMLANYYQIAAGAGEGRSFDFDISAFCANYKLKPPKTMNSLKLLEQSGLISMSEAVYTPSRVMILMNKEELYRFEIANARFEPLLKLILRKYGGIFENYIQISESFLSVKLNMTMPDVIRQIFHMHKLGVLAYAYQKEKAQVTFVLPRADFKYIPLNRAFVTERKENFEQQLGAVLDYAENSALCRNNILVEYFGETTVIPCGRCDVCLGRNKKPDAKADTAEIADKIEQALNGDTLSVQELVNLIPRYNKADVLNALQWMLDNEKLVQSGDAKFSRNR